MQIQVVQGRQTGMGCVQMLQKLALVTEGPRLCGDELHFQQDNSATHNALHTSTFMQENGIHVLDLPACSPYLNPIEMLTSTVHNLSP